MRTGDYKQTYGELVALIDSPPVLAVVGGAGAGAGRRALSC